MNDPRIEIPSGLRNAGILGGLIMIALGLWIGWQRSGEDIVLEPTGYKPPEKGPSSFDKLIETLVEMVKGKKE